MARSENMKLGSYVIGLMLAVDKEMKMYHV
jgi:hypothetical protein